ncbi:hypothetical protein DdX_15585 [Ditylenchus destructor]|uniref:Uncharacterized protein n=1 Tax=Ditylenchus destructor TaxID=166010 RepID=A0AAD4MUP5_9BILA|nr:hypothetical protein DdX_15585 [Ditylenchus destructor]
MEDLVKQMMAQTQMLQEALAKQAQESRDREERMLKEAREDRERAEAKAETKAVKIENAWKLNSVKSENVPKNVSPHCLLDKQVPFPHKTVSSF